MRAEVDVIFFCLKLIFFKADNNISATQKEKFYFFFKNLYAIYFI